MLTTDRPCFYPWTQIPGRLVPKCLCNPNSAYLCSPWEVGGAFTHTHGLSSPPSLYGPLILKVGKAGGCCRAALHLNLPQSCLQGPQPSSHTLNKSWPPSQGAHVVSEITSYQALCQKACLFLPLEGIIFTCSEGVSACSLSFCQETREALNSSAPGCRLSWFNLPSAFHGAWEDGATSCLKA